MGTPLMNQTGIQLRGKFQSLINGLHFRRICYVFIFILGLLSSLGIFFRTQFLTHFGIVFGDRADGLIEISILEHWRNVFLGVSPWMRTLFFYPARDTLGYNDGYFIYGVIFSIWRGIGINPFISSDLTNIVIKIIGFVSFFLISFRIFRCPLPIGVLFSMIFTLTNSTYVNAYHAQLLSVSFAPLITILAYEFIKSAPSNKFKSCLIGCFLAILFDCWLISTFYTIWFFVYGSSICFFIFLLLNIKNTNIFNELLIWVKESFIPIAATISTLIIGIIPFWHVYHFTSRAVGMHPLSEVQSYLPSLIDIINVGPNNIVYGHFITSLSLFLGDSLPIQGEKVMGLPFGILLLSIIFIIKTMKNRKLENKLIISLVIGVPISWFITISFYGHNVWRLLYKYFPGAVAVRVISRYELFLSFPLTIFAMLGFYYLFKNKNTPLYILLGVIVSGFLIAEEINRGWPLGLMPHTEMSRLQQIGVPPKNCKVFYVVNSRNGEMYGDAGTDGVYGNNVDAMIIAEYFKLPTINGTDSFMPPEWNINGYRYPDYKNKIDEYINKNNIKNICSLDLYRMVWKNTP